jgi:hypothetical protein
MGLLKPTISPDEKAFKFGFVCLLKFIGYCFFVLSPSSGRKYQRGAAKGRNQGFSLWEPTSFHGGARGAYAPR